MEDFDSACSSEFHYIQNQHQVSMLHRFYSAVLILEQNKLERLVLKSFFGSVQHLKA
jgi:hypothetical protein